MSSNNDFGITFDLPKNKSNVIKVIGVGGGGSNAINHMFRQGIKGVDFVICNTDAQALQNSGVPNKIQLGVNLTEGLGAGANPEIGEQAAIESLDEIKQLLNTNTKMIFITAGMGGGTGTGAAPVIARIAKELDILTVGIVTMPFLFEGKIRNQQAAIGVETLRAHVDSLVVINNNKLREVYGNLGFKAGFSKADEVLATASKGIAEVITHHYTQNIDLRDAKTVLSNSGTAIMGASTASGSNRAQDAIMKALDSPLLNDNKITGAKNVLLLIVSGSQEITIDEIGEINDHIQTEAGYGANIIMGVGEDDSLEESISVTIIATGFDVDQQDEITNTETKKVIHSLTDDTSLAKQTLSPEQEITTTTPRTVTDKTIVDKKDPKIIHVLNDDNDTPEMDLISMTEAIRNIEIQYEDIIFNNAKTNDLIINDVSNNPETDEPIAKEEQTTLTFDLPIAPAKKIEEEEEKVSFDLNDDIKNLPVNDYTELVPITEINEQGEKKYSLDDDCPTTDHNKPKEQLATQELIIEADENMVFERKTVDDTPKTETEKEDQELDPMNSSISKVLKERADQRRLRMKEFNYKFNNAKIDDIEKEPAYKRQGVDLNEAKHSSEATEISRLSVTTDDNDDVQLRENNSFLHDNVD